MRGEYRLICMGLCLFVGGCVWETPELPKEIAAVLADSSFSEVVEVTHQGSLDGLEGCWGSYRVIEGWTDAVFYRFGDDGFRWLLHSTFPFPSVMVYEGPECEKGADGKTVVVTVTELRGLNLLTGDWDDLSFGHEGTITFEVSLDGDRMEIRRPDVDAEQYEGTFWRFDECP